MPSKGFKHTKESKEKMREKNKGKHLSFSTEFKQGITPWNKGLSYHIGYSPSDETKRKIGLANSKPKIHLLCGICNTEFLVWPAHSKQKFCSKVF